MTTINMTREDAERFARETSSGAHMQRPEPEPPADTFQAQLCSACKRVIYPPIPFDGPGPNVAYCSLECLHD